MDERMNPPSIGMDYQVVIAGLAQDGSRAQVS
jgi:hypothetical protein